MHLRQEWLDNANSQYYTKEETIANVRENFDIRRYYSAEGYSVAIDEHEEQVVVQNHSNPINESDVDKKLLLPVDSIAKTGSYIDYRDSKWMIISNINIVDDAYKMCQMQYCNYMLQFQDEKGTILSYPCITSNNKFGNIEGKTITLSANQKSILLPKDENTLMLATDRRLFVDTRNQTPYKIIGDVDTTTYNYGDKGLIEILVEQDELQASDRQDLGICNYFEPSGEPTPTPTESGYAEIYASGDLILGNEFRTLIPTFYNQDGSVNDTITAVWEFEFPSDESDFTVTYDGNYARVSVAENWELLGMSVVARVSNGHGGFVGELEILIMV